MRVVFTPISLNGLPSVRECTGAVTEKTLVDLRDDDGFDTGDKVPHTFMQKS
jgi:hypothetical protein